MDLIDQDWLRIADWYRPGTIPQCGIDHRELWTRESRTSTNHHDGCQDTSPNYPYSATLAAALI